MRLAVLSDIHSNIEALDAVLDDLDAVGVDAVVSLGDNIDYGPDPEGVVDRLLEREIPSVAGNHELALTDPRIFAWFNPTAQRSLTVTMGLLSRRTLDYASGLPINLDSWNALFVHGCPPASATRYLFQLPYGEVKRLLENLEQSFCFVGHTHEVGLTVFDGRTVVFPTLREGVNRVEGERKHIVNVGSVGQPRDGDRRAAYVVWDDEARTVEVRRVPYDFRLTARKILALGFPEINARRLG